MNLIYAGIAAMSSTFLRGIQNKNVAAGYLASSCVVGAIMCACDMMVVMIVATQQSLQTIVVAALGAGLGWVTGMKIHDLLTRKRRKEQRRLEKEKLKLKVIKWTRQHFVKGAV